MQRFYDLRVRSRKGRNLAAFRRRVFHTLEKEVYMGVILQLPINGIKDLKGYELKFSNLHRKIPKVYDFISLNLPQHLLLKEKIKEIVQPFSFVQYSFPDYSPSIFEIIEENFWDKIFLIVHPPFYSKEFYEVPGNVYFGTSIQGPSTLPFESFSVKKYANHLIRCYSKKLLIATDINLRNKNEIRKALEIYKNLLPKLPSYNLFTLPKKIFKIVKERKS